MSGSSRYNSPNIAERGDMEEMERRSGICQELRPKVYGWNVRVDTTHIKITN